MYPFTSESVPTEKPRKPSRLDGVPMLSAYSVVPAAVALPQRTRARKGDARPKPPAEPNSNSVVAMNAEQRWAELMSLDWERLAGTVLHIASCKRRAMLLQLASALSNDGRRWHDLRIAFMLVRAGKLRSQMLTQLMLIQQSGLASEMMMRSSWAAVMKAAWVRHNASQSSRMVSWLVLWHQTQHGHKPPVKDPVKQAADDKVDIRWAQIMAQEWQSVATQVLHKLICKRRACALQLAHGLAASALLSAQDQELEHNEEEFSHTHTEEEFSNLGSQLLALGGIASPEYAKMRQERMAQLSALRTAPR